MNRRNKNSKGRKKKKRKGKEGGEGGEGKGKGKGEPFITDPGNVIHKLIHPIRIHLGLSL